MVEHLELALVHWIAAAAAMVWVATLMVGWMVGYLDRYAPGKSPCRCTAANLRGKTR